MIANRFKRLWFQNIFGKTTKDFYFHFKTKLLLMTLILIWNHYCNGFTQHCRLPFSSLRAKARFSSPYILAKSDSPESVPETKSWCLQLPCSLRHRLIDCIAFSSHIFSKIHRATSQIVRICQVFTRFGVALSCLHCCYQHWTARYRLHRCEYHGDRDDTVTLSIICTYSIFLSASGDTSDYTWPSNIL